MLAAGLCFFILAAAYSGEAAAATSRGVHFEDEMTVGGELLTLQGIGLLKWKYLVNVYLVGLYKPDRVPVTGCWKTCPNVWSSIISPICRPVISGNPACLSWPET